MATTSLASAIAGDAVESCEHCGLPVPRGRGAAARFCCFGCSFARALSGPAEAPGSEGALVRPGTLVLRLGLGVFLGMNIMVFSWLNYSRDLFAGAGRSDPHEAAVSGLFSYILLVLATGVLVTLGGPLLYDTLIGSDGHWRPRLDAGALILIGVGAAYCLSVVHTVRGEGGLYFDTAAVILVLVTLGNSLESAARRRAFLSARDLLAAVPDRARVERGGAIVEIEADRLEVGDRIVVRPGEVIAADGRVAVGRSHVDESALTGEALPRAVGPGDAVLAGGICRDGQLGIDATRVGAARAIALTQALLDRARGMQPPIQRLADRVAAVFVPAVLALALGVFAGHAAGGDATRGLFDALSVLLISCPCALGLAAPLATHFALHRAAALGVLVDSPVTLERAASIRRIFLDKTGTLTEPRLELCEVAPAPGLDPEAALARAAAIETASLHPLALPLVAAAAAAGLVVPAATGARALPGLGVTARVGGEDLWLGSARLVAERGLDLAASGLPAGDGRALTSIYLMDAGRVLARFSLRERLRDGAARAVAGLRALGIEASVLSGDGEVATAAVARQLGIGHAAALLPADKLARLAAARAAAGGAVAMVGDGINDAPVLAAADVGFVMGGGTDLARRSGHVWLLGDRLERIPEALQLARHALAAVRWNLFWAFGYNLIGVALAASGRLTPIFSAVAMFGSSLFVIYTSTRAGRIAGGEAQP